MKLENVKLKTWTARTSRSTKTTRDRECCVNERHRVTLENAARADRRYHIDYDREKLQDDWLNSRRCGGDPRRAANRTDSKRRRRASRPMPSDAGAVEEGIVPAAACFSAWAKRSNSRQRRRRSDEDKQSRTIFARVEEPLRQMCRCGNEARFGQRVAPRKARTGSTRPPLKTNTSSTGVIDPAKVNAARYRMPRQFRLILTTESPSRNCRNVKFRSGDAFGGGQGF